MDSSVSKGAFSQGRSSSRALQPILKRSAWLQLVGGQYLSISFAPTRLNIADDPTRLVALRTPAERSLRIMCSPPLLQSLHGALHSRPVANWIRLWISVVSFQKVEAEGRLSSSIPCLCGFSSSCLYLFAVLWISLFVVLWIFMQPSLTCFLTFYTFNIFPYHRLCAASPCSGVCSGGQWFGL